MGFLMEYYPRTDLGWWLGLLILLVVVGLIFWLIWWFIGYVNPPEPFRKVAQVLVGLFAVIFLIVILIAGARTTLRSSGTTAMIFRVQFKDGK